MISVIEQGINPQLRDSSFPISTRRVFREEHSDYNFFREQDEERERRAISMLVNGDSC